ncbi:hypothetical protein ScPMuIL_016559 [Solemya velum]
MEYLVLVRELLPSLICGLREKDPDLLKFNFAILVAGFKSRQSQHKDLYSIPISIPSLHILVIQMLLYRRYAIDL